MKPKTDYAQIAARYNRDRSVYAVDADPDVTATGGPVVDVGCGTGTWLAAQDVPLSIGVDPSAAMVRQAQGCVVLGRAEALPLATGFASWVESRFCFHHFDDERAFLREAWRVLGDGGVLRLVNVMPLEDAGWLLHDLFPETRAVDARRWPKSAELAEWIGAAGFRDVRVTTEPTAVERRVDEYIDTLRSRTISQLALIDDGAFASGMERAARLEGTIKESGAIWTFRARR